MNRPSSGHVVMSVDDDADTRRLVEQLLVNNGYEVITAESGKEALRLVSTVKPDLILLDVMMPGMDGYETCLKLQENRETSYIPVVFLTALQEEQDKARAFAAGAVDFLSKPIQKGTLLEKVSEHLKTKDIWKKLDKALVSQGRDVLPSDFVRFKKFLEDELELSDNAKDRLARIEFPRMYPLLNSVGIKGSQLAKLIAKYFGFRYLPVIDPDTVRLGVLPAPFSKNNSVIALEEKGMANTYVLSNPFNLELLETLKKYSRTDKMNFFVTEPGNIDALLEYGIAGSDKKAGAREEKVKILVANPQEIEEKLKHIERGPVVHVMNTILYDAVTERASDIHIEPEEDRTLVRFRIDGDMKDAFSFNSPTGAMVLTRLKALAGLNIAEKQKSQNGTLDAMLGNRKFRMRLATTVTPNGENLFIRVFEPDVKQKSLSELGFADQQVNIMSDFSRRTEGLILVVGPAGSGRTTTAYSLLAQIDRKERSFITVEDPVEYRIPFATQQQVDEKAGATFEALLKSSTSKDPDILFIGEIKDQYSGKVAVDFSGKGRLTIATLRSPNATAAIRRLEVLGITRKQMADTIVGVVAQRLLKRLCPHCKKIISISKEKADISSSFINQLPAQVAYPIGCPRCGETGYLGRETIAEVIKFDPEIGNMIRSNKTVTEIRTLLRAKGHYLIDDHAFEKLRHFFFSPIDVYDKVVIEEDVDHDEIAEGKPEPAVQEPEEKDISAKRAAPANNISILVAEDDDDTRMLISRFLEGAGYKVTPVKDGVDALIQLAQREFDLVISDIEMPNLDGFKFIEIKNQKRISAPVVFLTSHTSQDYEMKCLELGAVDFIKKPVKKDILLLRITKVLDLK